MDCGICRTYDNQLIVCPILYGKFKMDKFIDMVNFKMDKFIDLMCLNTFKVLHLINT